MPLNQALQVQIALIVPLLDAKGLVVKLHPKVVHVANRRLLLKQGLKDLEEDSSRLLPHVEVAGLVGEKRLPEALIPMVFSLGQSILSFELHTALEDLLTG